MIIINPKVFEIQELIKKEVSWLEDTTLFLSKHSINFTIRLDYIRRYDELRSPANIPRRLIYKQQWLH